MPRPSMSHALRSPASSSARWLLPAVVLTAALAGCTSFDEQQRKWIVQASTLPSSWSGSTEGMQDVWIEHASASLGGPVRLHGLWLPQERADAPVLLYLHGARRNVSDSSFRIRNMHE